MANIQIQYLPGTSPAARTNVFQHWHVIGTDPWLEHFNKDIIFICFECTNTVKPLSNVPKFKVFLHLRFDFNDSKKKTIVKYLLC